KVIISYPSRLRASALVFETDFRERAIAGMRDAQSDVPGSHAFCVLARYAMEEDGRPPAGLARHFNIPPAHALAPAGAQGLHGRFLGGKAPGVTLRAVAMPFAVGDLGRSKDAVQKHSAVAPDCFADSSNLLHVHAQADNHGARSSWLLRPTKKGMLRQQRIIP